MLLGQTVLRPLGIVSKNGFPTDFYSDLAERSPTGTLETRVDASQGQTYPDPITQQDLHHILGKVDFAAQHYVLSTPS